MVLPQDDPAKRLLTEANAALKYTRAVSVVVDQSNDGNDYPAMQAILNLASTKGSVELVIPYTGKDWSLPAKLMVFNNTTIRCMPGVVIKRTGNSYGITNIEPGVNPLRNNTDPYSGHGNIRIIGGTWDGNVIAQPYVTGNATTPGGFNLFYFAGARDVLVEDVTVLDMVSNHAIDLNGCADVTVRRSKFLGYVDASGGNRANAEAIQCSTNMDDSNTAYYPMLGAPSKGITVEKCTFGASGTTGTAAYPAGFGTHSSTNDPFTNNITIRNSSFEGCTFAAIAGWTYNDLKVLGNTFTGCKIGVKVSNFTSGKTWDKATSAYITGQATRGQISGVYVIGNTFRDTSETDISIQGTNSDVSNGSWAYVNDVEVIGNVCTSSTSARRTGYNISALFVRNGKILANECANAADNIIVNTSTGVDVSNNTVDNAAAHGIRFLKGSTPTGTDAKLPVNNRAQGNTITNAGTHGLGVFNQYEIDLIANKISDWGRITVGSFGININATDGALVDGNNVRSLTTGLGNGISVAGGSTNVAVTQTNRVVKPDGTKVFVSGTGSTYGALQYV